MPETDTAYQVLFEKNPSAMFAFDRETLAILTVNEAACAGTGFHSRNSFP